MLKYKFIFALLLIIVVILINQVLIQVDLNKQSNDANVINVAGKQRMFSQQITKIAYEASELSKNSLYNNDIKVLEKVIDTFTQTNNYLKKINTKDYKKSSIDSLFKINQTYYSIIVNSSNKLIKNPNDELIFDEFITSIKENEASFLITMDAIVDEYQQVSEDRLTFLKKIQILSTIIKLLVILTLFFFVLLPLSKKNKNLTFLNKELKKFKNEVKEKEKEKKNIEEILDRTNEVARIGTWEVDLSNQKVTWSRITKEIHEVEQDFIPDLTTGINFYKEGESRDKITKLVSDSMKNGSTYDTELQIITAKGKEVWVRVIGKAELIKGKCVRIFGVFQDINEVKIYQEKLIAKNNQLANFAHITSHNLRAPVSNLNSLLSLYNMSEDPKEKSLIFSKFKVVISHLSSTLNTLVEAIKIKEKKDIELEEVYFQDLLTKAEELFSGDIINKKATIIADFSEVEKIVYNKVYLESIITNLISNSLKYNSLDRILKIKISTKIHNNKIQLLVTDNGLGIDLEKHKHKIFGLNKVFHRHKDSKGVGLYILKNQIESLGGSISVQSEVEKGTTMIVEF